MHNDSGAALEAIGFAYAAQTPLPEGHEWLFAVAGCIHPLPVDREGFVFVAVRGKGVHHGTLPTSSTEPHFANHAGIGSALVNKSDLVTLLGKHDEPDQLPFPTPEELKAQQAKVAAEKAAEKKQGPLAKAARDLAETQRALEDAQRKHAESLQNAAKAVGDEGGGTEGEAGSSAQGEVDAAKQAIHAAEQRLEASGLLEVTTATAKAAERLQAMAGPDPLVGAVPVEAAEGEEDEEQDAAAVEMPRSATALFKRMSDPDEQFGVSRDRSCAMAAPAMGQLKEFCTANDLDVPSACEQYGYGQPLPDEYVIVHVRRNTPPSRALCGSMDPHSSSHFVGPWTHTPPRTLWVHGPTLLLALCGSMDPHSSSSRAL